MPTREELRWGFGPVDDPEIEGRRQHILKVLMKQDPILQQQLIDKGLMEGRLEGWLKGWLEGRLTEARAALRRMLARRMLAPSGDDDARIEACTDLATLERWHDQAVTATSVSDALG